MDDNMDTVGTTSALPVEGVSAKSSAIDFNALAEALKPIIQQEVQTASQSVKDKRIAKLLSENDGFESRLARLEEYTSRGVSKEDALWRMRVEDAIDKPVPQEPVGKQENAASTDVELLSQLKLDANDPDVTKLLREDNQVERIAKLAALAVQRSQTSVPSPASVMQTAVGMVPVRDDPEKLAQELEKLDPIRDKEQFASVKERLTKSLK